MTGKRFLAVVAGAAMVAGAGTASGQTLSCQCDCYFSFDCPGGQSCNYGSLPIEDSCFWRRPKPQGNPGTQCNEDYGDWGQCDGICTGSSSVAAFSGEFVEQLGLSVALWGSAYTQAAVGGGGLPAPSIVAQVRNIDFAADDSADRVGRVVGELLLLVHGQSFLQFPKKEAFVFGEATVADLSGQDEKIRAGRQAVDALILEMTNPGDGETVVRDIPLAALNHDLFTRVCDGQTDAHGCLYDRIVDMADTLARAGRDPAPSNSPASAQVMGSFPPCLVKGDFDNDQDVDQDDFPFMTVCAYGTNTLPPPDPGTTESDDECMMIFDMDSDSDIDLMDLNLFFRLASRYNL